MEPPTMSDDGFDGNRLPQRHTRRRSSARHALAMRHLTVRHSSYGETFKLPRRVAFTWRDFHSHGHVRQRRVLDYDAPPLSSHRRTRNASTSGNATAAMGVRLSWNELLREYRDIQALVPVSEMAAMFHENRTAWTPLAAYPPPAPPPTKMENARTATASAVAALPQPQRLSVQPLAKPAPVVTLQSILPCDAFLPPSRHPPVTTGTKQPASRSPRPDAIETPKPVATLSSFVPCAASHKVVAPVSAMATVLSSRAFPEGPNNTLTGDFEDPLESTTQMLAIDQTAATCSVPTINRATAMACFYPPSTERLQWVAVSTPLDPLPSRLGDPLVDIGSLSLPEPPVTHKRFGTEELLQPLSAIHHSDEEENIAAKSLDSIIASGQQFAVELTRTLPLFVAIKKRDTTKAQVPLALPELEPCKPSAPRDALTGDSPTESLPFETRTSPPPRKASKSPHPKDYNDYELVPLKQRLTMVTSTNESYVVGKSYSGIINNTDEAVVVRVVADAVSLRIQPDFDKMVATLVEISSANPSIATVYGSVTLLNEQDGTSVQGFVMENVLHLDSLATVLHYHHHKPQQAGSSTVKGSETQTKIRLLLQLIEAIQWLHSHGIVNGDLNAQNVVVSQDGNTIKLVNTGFTRIEALARSSNYAISPMEANDARSLPGSSSWLVGCTPAYASPEVLRGELSRHDLDGWKRNDMYSFTVLLVELMLETPPWEGETPLFVWNNAVSHLDKRPYDLQELHSDGKKCRALETLVRSGWHEDPQQRPTACEMAQGLRFL